MDFGFAVLVGLIVIGVVLALALRNAGASRGGDGGSSAWMGGVAGVGESGHGHGHGHGHGGDSGTHGGFDGGGHGGDGGGFGGGDAGGGGGGDGGGG